MPLPWMMRTWKMPRSTQAKINSGTSSLISRGLKVCRSSTPSIGAWMVSFTPQLYTVPDLELEAARPTRHQIVDGGARDAAHETDDAVKYGQRDQDEHRGNCAADCRCSGHFSGQGSGEKHNRTQDQCDDKAHRGIENTQHDACSKWSDAGDVFFHSWRIVCASLTTFAEASQTISPHHHIIVFHCQITCFCYGLSGAIFFAAQRAARPV